MRVVVMISSASPELLADLEARPKRGRAQRLRELAQIGLGAVRARQGESETTDTVDRRGRASSVGSNASSHSDALIDQLGGNFDDPDS